MRRLLVSSLTVAALAAGYATLDAYDRAPGILTLAPVPAQTQSPAASPSTTPPGMTLPHLPAATTVLPQASQTAPMPTPAGLAAAVKGPLADPSLGQKSVLVRDAATKRLLLSTDPSRARTPASTAKLLSAAAVLDTLGPTTTLTTRVLGPTTEGRIWLVAGGDTLLSPGQG
ncbi:MAG TPA: D-alanyl-D-alanine carboxypeptidase [Candidatus Lustribacter sp.]|nr:D-alanyl-D-alanine carboxypeptidase [Candidatus Lustribacter sp.]